MTSEQTQQKKRGQRYGRIFAFSVMMLLAFTAFYTTKYNDALAGAIVNYTQNPPGSTLSSGLVGWWTFDGKDMTSTTSIDRSGSGNNGIINGSPNRIPGKIGQGLEITGNTQYVNEGKTSSLNNIAKLTIAFWARGSGNAAPQGVAFDKFYWSFNLSTGIFIRAFSGTTGEWMLSSTFSPLGEWHHYVITYDDSSTSNNPIFYIDGSATSSNRILAPTGAASSDATIELDAPQNSFRGVIDDVRIYNRILSPTEIKQLYLMGAGTRINHSQVAPPGSTLVNGLVGYWSLDRNALTTATATDMSENGNDAAISASGGSDIHSVPGKIGQGLSIDSSLNGKSLSVASSTSMDSTHAIKTISMWIYPKNAGSSNGFMVSQRSSDWAFVFEHGNASYPDRSLRYYDIFSGTNPVWVTATDTLAYNEWQHVAITYDGTSASNQPIFYVNGVATTTITQSAPTGSLSPDSSGVRIGDGCSSCFIGMVGYYDDVRIYNRILSAAEIKQLYNEGQGLTVAKSQQGTVPSGLVGYWSFNQKQTHWSSNTTDDLSGQGNTGTMVNMSTTSSPAPGRIGQGLKFDGVNDFVSANDSASLDVTGDLTVSAWIRPTSLAVSSEIVNKQWCNGNQYSWTLSVNTSRQLRLDWDSDGDCAAISGVFTSNSSVIPVGDWSHVVAVKNSSSVTLYVNGVSVPGTLTGSYTSMFNSSAPLKIGIYRAQAGTYANGFTGTIDEVRVYNRALSASEVEQLYNAGR